MLFSVVIPTFNRAAWLYQTLESVLSQTFRDFEVIVVDDGSTDDTAKVVRELDTPIQFISQANRGAGAARNTGAGAAKGDYLSFLDSDDLWFPWTLASFADALKRHHSPAIVGAKVMEFTGTPPVPAGVPDKLQVEVFANFLASHAASHDLGAGMAILKRDIFLKIGGYSEQPINLEDHDLILRMSDSPGYVQILAPATLAYRRHPASATMNLARNVQGAFYLLHQEKRRVYPGDSKCQWQRRQIITRHLRPISLACLREKALPDGWRIYGSTIIWHVRLGRWRYLLGFPFKAFFAGQC